MKKKIISRREHYIVRLLNQAVSVFTLPHLKCYAGFPGKFRKEFCSTFSAWMKSLSKL